MKYHQRKNLDIASKLFDLLYQDILCSFYYLKMCNFYKESKLEHLQPISIECRHYLRENS
jgi:hypothetical protein